MFYGIEKALTDAMIRALRNAQQALFDMAVGDAVSRSHVQHKGDTLGLDQRPENAITASLQEFDPYCVTITEERGTVNPFKDEGSAEVFGNVTFFASDPFDRSNQACQFLQEYGDPNEKVIDVFRHASAGDRWLKKYGGPLSITTSTSAIACIRRGLPVASVILHHLTEEMTVACAAGIYHIKLPSDFTTDVTWEYVKKKGKPLHFPQPTYSNGQKIVAFVGKPERGYPENFKQCRLVADYKLEQHLHCTDPGGPARVLYLSNLQATNEPIGVVVANGEKIGEWTHWLPFIRFARRPDDNSAAALRMYEVSQKKPGMIDGYLTMPSPDYSIFINTGSQRTTKIRSEKLQDLSNPSKYRSTLILIPASNQWALNQVEQYGYQEIAFPRP